MSISKKLMSAGGSSKAYALIGKGLPLDVSNEPDRNKRIEVLKVTSSGAVSLHQEYDLYDEPTGNPQMYNKGAVRVSPDNQYVAITSVADNLINLAYDSSTGLLSPAGVVELRSANNQVDDGLDLTWHPDSQEVAIARNDPNINSNLNEAFTRYNAGSLGPSRMGKYNDSSNLGNEGVSISYIPGADPASGSHRLMMWGVGSPYVGLSIGMSKGNSIDISTTYSPPGSPSGFAQLQFSPFANTEDAIAIAHSGSVWWHFHVKGLGGFYQTLNNNISSSDGRFAWIPHEDSTNLDCYLLNIHSGRINIMQNIALGGTTRVATEQYGDLGAPEDVAVSHDGMIGACTFDSGGKRQLVIVDLSTPGTFEILSKTELESDLTECRMEFAKDFIGS